MKIHTTITYVRTDDETGNQSCDSYEFDWEGEDLDGLFSTVQKFNDKYQAADEKYNEESQPEAKS